MSLLGFVSFLIMLPKEYRLKRMKDFEILFKEGSFVASDLVTAKIWKINPEKYPKRKYSQADLKIGFVAGLKVSKIAVSRNRIKRQMREIVRLLLREEKIRPGFMLAFVAKPAAVGQDYAGLEKSILAILRQARLLK